MYAIGHFALGYIAGKVTSNFLKTKINLPLLLMVSVIPDIDLLLGIANPAIFMHRGLTHSLVTYTVILVPFFIMYKKQVIPYYAVFLSHSLIGDLFSGGIEAFWPLSQAWFGNALLEIGSTIEAATELFLFAAATAIMLKTGDLQTLIRPEGRNLILIIPFGAVLGPMLAVGKIEGNLPALLVVPSLFWMVLFAYSMFLGLTYKTLKTGRHLNHAAS